MTMTLDDVAQAYLADEEYQKMCRDRAKARDRGLPSLQAVIRRFIRAETNVQTFRAELEKTNYALENVGEQWALDL